LLEKCIFPALVYGCQTWTLTKKNENVLEIQKRKFLRSILKIKQKDKVSNRILESKAKSKSVLNMAKKLKWNWGGHVLRVRDNRWTKQIIEWHPYGQSRKKGKPSTRWDHDFVKYGGATWSRAAKEKAAWEGASKLFFD